MSTSKTIRPEELLRQSLNEKKQLYSVYANAAENSEVRIRADAKREAVDEMLFLMDHIYR